jgi:hypothetical protein
VARRRLLRLVRLVVDYFAYASHTLSSTTSLMSCIRTCRLAARLLVSRAHWLSSCAQSLCLASRLRCRLTCCPVALALLQPCHAP